MTIMDFLEGKANGGDCFDELQSEIQELKGIAKNAKEDFGELGNDFVQINKELFAEIKGKIPVKRGAIVYARLDNSIVHFGIYMGENQILDKLRLGQIRIVSPYQFCLYNREEPILKIYCAAGKDGKVIFSDEIATEAESLYKNTALSQDESFSSLQFVASCLKKELQFARISFQKLEKLISVNCYNGTKISWRLADLNFNET
jgi:hypothetical protein